MARKIGGILASSSLLLALIATFNVHFGEPPPGQIIIGALALILAFVFTASLQDSPNIQRIATFGLMAEEALMIVPTILQSFTGQAVSGVQIVVTFIGAILFFISWRMLPR